jgi:DUF1680 family protein
MKTRILFVSMLLAVAASLSAQTQARVVEPFKLNQVTLLQSQFKSAMDRTCSYQLFLNTDRMLYSFRENYGLSTKGATPAGGLETNRVRGYTVGHMLSALSQAYASTGDNRYKLKADTLVSELAICQNADASKGFSAGYLSGFPESSVDEVYNQKCPWAPFWAIHKIFQGMIDCYNLTGNATALDIATKMGDWAYNKLKNYTQAQRETMWTYFCANAGEYGGFNESMINLYDLTKNPNHLATAKFFDHQALFGPALRNKDSLNGFHANTQIPKFVGAARIFEATGEANYYTIPKNFFSIVTSAHMYIDGANSIGEWFKPPYQIASQLGDNTGESCNVYNMLKLARLLFFHDPQEKYMAYFERTLYNHVLGTQNPKSAHGNNTYFIPLRSGGIKTYGSDYDGFLCCDGTGQESHTKYGETIYGHAGDTLYVNLFIPSQLNWTEKNVTVKMDTRYPDNDTVKLTLSGTGAANLPIRFRVPSWLRRSMEVWANGALVSVHNDTGTYAKFLPAWNAGGTITVVIPQSLRYELTPDDKTVGGVFYGSQVLAGCYGTNNLSSTPTLSASTISKINADTLNFNATPSTGATTLIPFSRMHNQRYSVYWKLTNVPRDTFIHTAQVKTAPPSGIGEPESRRLQPPRLTISSGDLLFAFSSQFAGSQPVRIRVFNARGAVVANKQAVPLRGARIVRVRPDKGALVPGVYLCSVQANKEDIRSKIIVADAF